MSPKDHTSARPSHETFDAVIVGAGFAGLYMLHRLRALGLSVRVLEAGGDVGGTWYWNRYPGCRCDVESMEYSYGFDEGLQQTWNWTERYAAQPEILAYARHVAERFALRPHIDFDTRVNAARWNAATRRWEIETADGRRLRARWCVMATGVLSAGRLPEIDGLSAFGGQVLHTSTWPHEGVDFTGRRVAVMGVGSSGVQVIPQMAAQAQQLHVLLRTPNYVVPARNRPLAEEEVAAVKSRYGEFRQTAREGRGGVVVDIRPQSALAVDDEERERGFEERWQRGGSFAFQSSFSDIQLDIRANRLASDFLRGKIAQTVRNPTWARWLQPDHLLGSRRLCVGTDFYETFNRPNVDLVNLREEPVQRFTRDGIIVGERELALDAMVFATGFDAITGALSAIDIEGVDGRRLADHWRDGARAYLGLMCAGFPNLFLLTGPGSPAVLSNVLVSIEQHVDWVARCLEALARRDHTVIQPTAEAEAEWADHVHALGQRTLFADGQSWYLGSNVPGKPRVFLPYAGGVPAFREACERVLAEDLRGFVRS